ncbi:acetylcholinesterase-like protein [Dinothrombium tinctorium]|uniref:Acetylcholinesterase-like protein n=1 Tax=Dinothrombium tinctorium TaxID=1965070 RepID=A0A443QIQ8_9ACAR|nr:acetylcholinesterase-like protein [Dinothrombium tinctorium]
MLNCESTEENEENSKAFSKSTIECLRKADATKFGDIFPLMFWPLFGDSLLPHSIKLSLKKGDFKRNSSFLIGTVVNDGTVVPIVMKNNPKQSMIIVLHEFKRKNVKKLINYYFSNVNGSNLNESTWAFYNAFTDISFRCPSAYFAKILSQFNSIYQYIFARKPNVNINPFKKSGFEPGHHDEMPFTFGMVPDAEDFAVSMHWMKMLTHFAKHGKLPWQSYQNSNPQKSPFYKFIGDPQNNEVILSDIYTTCEKLFPEIFKKMY